jgi:hypothetical protein
MKWNGCLRDLLDPLDFSGIVGYPNDCEDYREELPKIPWT